MNLGGTVEIGDITAGMVDARHRWARSTAPEPTTLAWPQATHHAQGRPSLYHAGDTHVFGDMRLIGELYRPEVAMLPIGGHFTMGPREAAMAVRYLGAKTVLPLHWGTFPMLTGTPAELKKLVDDGVKVVEWSPGDVY